MSVLGDDVDEGGSSWLDPIIGPLAVLVLSVVVALAISGGEGTAKTAAGDALMQLVEGSGDDEMEDEWIVYAGVEAFSHWACIHRIRVAPHVTAIPGGAFSGCHGLREVDLANVSKIGGYAFQSCVELREVDLRNVQTIDRGAFRGCKALRSVAIPSTVMEIGVGVFACCFELEAVTLCDGLRAIGREAFRKCGKLENVAIPSTVTEVRGNAFCHCTKLTAVEFLCGIQTIGQYAFRDCPLLERIVIPSPAFTICAVGAGNTLRCHLRRDATIPPRDLRMVVSRHVKYMSPDRLEEAGRKINEILGRNEEEGQWEAQIRELFSYYELLDATTLLELAIWKAKMDQSMQNTRGIVEESRRKRARVHTSLERSQGRANSGAHIILPLVVPYIGQLR